jgi:hypothetical protein
VGGQGGTHEYNRNLEVETMNLLENSFNLFLKTFRDNIDRLRARGRVDGNLVLLWG